MTFKKPASFLLISGLISALSGCATYDPKTNEYSDPLAAFNEPMFDFNYHVLDAYILRPVAVAWKKTIPVPVRQGIQGVSSNLTEPSSMVNSFFQGDFDKGIKHLTRFFLNTVFGFGGLIDVAGRADPQLRDMERLSFGTMLGSYDVPYGPYVVLPFYGEATARQDLGGLVDYLYPPLSELTFEMAAIRWAIDGIEKRAMALEFDYLLSESASPYNFMRNAYFQRNDFLASGGQIDTEKQKQREAEISDFVDDLDE